MLWYREYATLSFFEASIPAFMNRFLIVSWCLQSTKVTKKATLRKSNIRQIGGLLALVRKDDPVSPYLPVAFSVDRLERMQQRHGHGQLGQLLLNGNRCHPGVLKGAIGEIECFLTGYLFLAYSAIPDFSCTGVNVPMQPRSSFLRLLHEIKIGNRHSEKAPV